MNTEETPPTKKVATIADAIACYHRTAGNTPPDPQPAELPWRPLDPGEIIQEGDEYMGDIEQNPIFSPADWRPVDIVNGLNRVAGSRSVDTLIFRTRRPLPSAPPDSGQAVSVHCRGFSEMPQETQDAIIKMCHAAKKDMESGAFDPQNEPRTCPYCDQPRQDTFENRWRFECGTALQRIDGKTVKQGSECKLRVAYSKLLVDWCKQKERISELKQAHAELLATKLPEYDRCETCNFELGPFGPLGTDGEPTTDCLVCQLREQTNKLRAALEWYAEQTRPKEAAGLENQPTGLANSTPEPTQATEAPAAGLPKPADASTQAQPSLDAFTANMPPMKRGAVLKALNTQVQSRGEILTRATLIERAVAAGDRVQTRIDRTPLTEKHRQELKREASGLFAEVANSRQDPNNPAVIRTKEIRAILDRGHEAIDEEVLMGVDGSFRDVKALTKAGIEYAKFLANAPTVPTVPDAPQGDRQPADPQARLKAALDALRKRKEQTGDGGRLASGALTGNPAFYSPYGFGPVASSPQFSRNVTASTSP